MNESTNDKILDGDEANEFLQKFFVEPLLIKDKSVSWQLHLIVLELKKLNERTNCNCNGK